MYGSSKPESPYPYLITGVFNANFEYEENWKEILREDLQVSSLTTTHLIDFFSINSSQKEMFIRDIYENIKVNVTLCFSAAQAILAAKAGATFISPFIGRLDDIGADGINLISEIVDIYDLHDFKTEVLAASIRSVQDIVDSAKLGAHVATIPPKILQSMYDHPLTDKGLSAFLKDWEKTGQSIL